MLSAIPSQYHLFFGIGSLVILLLLITGFAQKYQAYQLEKEAAIRRILRGVKRIEDILSMTDGCAIPRALLVLLRKEVLARYMAIYQIHKKLENLNSLITRAQKNLATGESKAEHALTRPADRLQFNQYVKGLTELITFLGSEGHIAGMNETERKQFQKSLVNLRADYISLFFTEEAKGLVEEQKWLEATRLIKEALQYFQHFGLSDAHAKDLYKSMSQFYRQVLDRNVPGITPEAPLDENAVSTEQAGAVQ